MHDDAPSTHGSPENHPRSASRITRALGLLASSAIVIAITFSFFVVVEGLSSILIAAKSSPDHTVLAERAHTEFDSEIGWVNEPRAHIDDLYGPGRSLRTNSQRFRGREELTTSVPQGRVRVLCSGDSFTLGYGVKDEDAWCALLGQKDTRLQPVNLGQGGYGVDQAYLWYRRAGGTLDHDIAVFAVPNVDFGRMMASTFYGYPKPVLSVREGKPVLERRASKVRYVMRGLGQRWQQLEHLRFVELWRRWHPDSAPQADTPVMSNDGGHALAGAIFGDLADLARRRHATLMVVFLPVIEDYRASEADEWREFLRSELRTRSISYLDLVDALRREPEPFVQLLFRGHYSELGNHWVADKVYDALVKLPEVSERLTRAGTPSKPISALVPSDTFLGGPPAVLTKALVEASSVQNEAALALDGSRKTRWQSGMMQNGHEELRVDLGETLTLRQVKLDLGEWPYDCARGLGLDAGEDQGHLVEVVRASGNDVLVDNVDGSGQAQILTLPAPIKARYLRIRQTGKSSDNFWSVAEIEVFGDK